MKPLQLGGVAALVVVAALLGAGTWHLFEGQGEAAAATMPELALEDLHGTPHRLADYRGQLVLINFWATWCPPCLREIPMLIEAQEDLGKKGLQVLGPALDPPPRVRRFAEAQGMNYPLFADVDAVGRALTRLGEAQGALPFTVLIDREGRRVAERYGEMTRADLDAMLAPYW